MLTRRAFAACALCAAGDFLATGVEAQQNAQTPGLTRTLLKRSDGPMAGYETVEMRIDIEPDAQIARHTHPGIESSYVVDGGFDLSIDGMGTQTLKAGESFQVPPVTPHSGKNGPVKTAIAGTFVVEKGKPLASPA